MQTKIFSTLIFLLTSLSIGLAQHTKPVRSSSGATVDFSKIKLDWPQKPAIPAQNEAFPSQKLDFKTLAPLQKIKASDLAPLEISRDDDGQPYFIKGKTAASTTSGSVEKRVFDYLESLRGVLLVGEPSAEFSISKITTDEQGKTHVRLQQIFQKIPVFGGEIIAHAEADGSFDMVNGRHFSTPDLTDWQPKMTADEAILISKNEIGHVKNLSADELILTGGQQATARLVILFEGKKAVLAYETDVFQDVLHRFQLMVDAKTGRVLRKLNQTCSIDGDRIDHRSTTFLKNETPFSEEKNMLSDGPTTSNGLDLNNVSRSFPTYEKSGLQYMIDASRTMFKASQSTFPNSPVGVIQGLDAKNTSPQNSNFTYGNLSNSGLTWSGANAKKAISAAWNSQKSYEFYKTKHNRESIDGVGGNIISLINVADDNGASMGNAFWNGEAMFYGNGDSFFKPLAGGLDVGGHELTHGVVQKTANLEYQGESGAMNESYADIFGVIIEGNNWKVGEDIMQPGVFPSGALRDLSNPHNGGSSLNDAYWQPAHVNEKYTGSQDNGGVHINSGIPNFAFYKFATNAAVGKDNAQAIFYKALDAYLVKSSKFKDLRVSVLQACNDLFPGNSAIQTAAATAFDEVGITGPSSSGGGNPNPGGNYSTDLQTNPGTEYMLVTTKDNQNLDILDATGSFPLSDYIYKQGVLSRPSVTDDGSQVVFVNTNHDVVYVQINWAAKTWTSQIISPTNIYHNVAISKNGQLLAATTETVNNQITVFDPNGNPQVFTLYNPTTSTGTVQTDEVQYADALEFDYSGESILYDAYNEVDDGAGNKISWWDIGFVDVWKNATNSFGNGSVDKLFSGLPENTSIGNPTFSKNSPYIVGFDYFEDFSTKNYVVGVNTQSGDNDAITENTTLGYPSFNRLDNKIAFETGTTTAPSISLHGVAAGKITGSGSTVLFQNDLIRPVYFSTGTRSLMVSTPQILAENEVLNAFPNPTSDLLSIEFSAKTSESAARLEVVNLLGEVVFSQNLQLAAGENRLSVSFQNWSAGAYVVRLQAGNRTASTRVLKN